MSICLITSGPQLGPTWLPSLTAVKREDTLCNSSPLYLIVRRKVLSFFKINFDISVGWAESFDIYLSEVPFEHIRVTSAKKALSVPVLNSIAAGVCFSKIGTGGVTVNFSMAPTTLKRTEDANFDELLTRESSAPRSGIFARTGSRLDDSEAPAY